MSSENRKTLDVYNTAVELYRDGTVQQTSGFQAEWIDYLLADLSADASILEIGSAFGRDADYMINKGYAPKLTDGSEGFVEYLRTHGYSAENLDIVSQEPHDSYDLVLACAVFLHFTEDDFRRAATHVKSALKPNGRFAFSVKYGEGEEWSRAKLNEPRYFHYWTQGELERVFTAIGMRIVDCCLVSDKKWLHAVVKIEEATHERTD